jgi:hypothetical protein
VDHHQVLSHFAVMCVRKADFDKRYSEELSAKGIAPGLEPTFRLIQCTRGITRCSAYVARDQSLEREEEKIGPLQAFEDVCITRYVPLPSRHHQPVT